MKSNIVPIEDYLNIIDMKDILYTSEILDDNTHNLEKNDKMILTKKHIKMGKRDNGWYKQQLAILGINFPPPKDWKDKYVGELFNRKQIDQFINYKEKLII